MGLCVRSLNQAEASAPHGQGTCGMVYSVELSDQVAQASLTSVWVESLPMKWVYKGRWWGWSGGAPGWGMTQQVAFDSEQNTWMLRECQILNCDSKP